MLLSLRSDSIGEYLNQVNSIPELSVHREEALCIELMDSGCVQAAHDLLMPYLRLAASVAIKMHRSGLMLVDLIQEANIGLMKAINNFNYTKGARLGTFAKPYIKYEVSEYIQKNLRITRVTTTASRRKVFYHLNRLLGSESLSTSNIDRIAEELDVTVDDVIAVYQQINTDSTFSTVPVLDYDSTSSDYGYSAFNPDHDTESVVLNYNRIESIQSGIKDLSQRELTVIQERFLDETPKTLKDIANEMGLSIERVRQITNSGIQKLRDKCEKY